MGTDELNKLNNETAEAEQERLAVEAAASADEITETEPEPVIELAPTTGPLVPPPTIDRKDAPKFVAMWYVVRRIAQCRRRVSCLAEDVRRLVLRLLHLRGPLHPIL